MAFPDDLDKIIPAYLVDGGKNRLKAKINKHMNKTFIYYEKNGSATITVSAQDESEADQTLSEIVKDPETFRLEEVMGEDEEE